MTETSGAQISIGTADTMVTAESGPVLAVVEITVALAEFGRCRITVEADGNSVLVSEPKSECYGEGPSVDFAIADLITSMREYRSILRREHSLSPSLQRHLDFLDALVRPRDLLLEAQTVGHSITVSAEPKHHPRLAMAA